MKFQPMLCICLLLLGATVHAAEPPPDPLFQENEPLAITLHGPFSRINDERDKDKEYEGSLRYLDADGAEVVLDASFQVRGNWRLNRRNCSYAPLWVDLRRGQLPGTVFENQNRLKVVVQCRRQDRYADYLYKELLLYRMFEHVADYNFDTRLLDVTYEDSEDDGDVRRAPAFFIEHHNRLAERYGMDEVEANRVSHLELQGEQGTLVSLFMYFIGNTDFSLIQGPPDDECCHNAKLLQAASGEYFPVPYDFDASGFVDTNYAPEPDPSLNLRSNRSRLYRGFCVEDSILQQAVDRFRQQQEALMAIVNDTSLLSERSVRGNARFIENFFETLNDPRDFRRAIGERCR